MRGKAVPSRRVGGAAILAAAPAGVIVAALLLGGILVSALEGFGLLDPIAGHHFTVKHFVLVLMTPGFAESFGLTILVSLISTALTVVLAVATAFALRRTRRFQRLVTYLYQLPLTLPHMVIAAAGIMLLSQSGLIARLATTLGVIGQPSEFPAVIYDRWGVGIILVYVWKQVPFVGLFAVTILQTVGKDYEAVARTLGARPGQAIRHVLLPLIAPGLMPASIIIFAFVFGAFEVPLLLGTRYPSMLSVLAYRLYTDSDLAMRPQSMALSLLIALFTFGLVAIYRLLARGRELR
jgi:putative spermidine/putrescine transport system permease protein